jgi:hypothetical protein
MVTVTLRQISPWRIASVGRMEKKNGSVEEKAATAALNVRVCSYNVSSVLLHGRTDDRPERRI